MKCPCPFCWEQAEADLDTRILKCAHCKRLNQVKDQDYLIEVCDILRANYQTVVDSLDSLKTCPFCGAAARLAYCVPFAFWEIGCVGEGDCCRMFEFDTLKEAIKQWNTRT